jgi:hypothetical protein
MKTLIFFLILGFLLWKSFKHYPPREDHILPREIENAFWLIITVWFVVFWGGIIWWLWG